MSYRLFALHIQGEIQARPKPVTKSLWISAGLWFHPQIYPCELRITSHVMTSSERLPPPPPMFVGATTGTGGEKKLEFAAASPRLSPGASPV